MNIHLKTSNKFSTDIMTSGADDVERLQAAHIAIDLWKNNELTNVPLCRFISHSCSRSKCNIVEIKYDVVFASKGKPLSVSLGSPPPSNSKSIEQLVPLYACMKSGQIHICGNECKENQIVCSISGLYFGEEIRDAWWAPYAREGQNNWKMNVFAKGRATRIDNPHIRKKLSLNYDQVYSASDILEQSRKRANIRTKDCAFDIAFAIVSTVLSDDRFEEALHRRNEQTAKFLDLARRTATHVKHRRELVNTGDLMLSLPATIQSNPVLIMSQRETRDMIVCYAERCLSTWHLLYSLASKKISDMSFRDFCVAAISLFGKGYNAPDWSSGKDVWIVPCDPILNVFPMDRWIERIIYSDMNDTKISCITRRAEKMLMKIVNMYVKERDSHGNYFRYEELPYESIPEDSFVSAKR